MTRLILDPQSLAKLSKIQESVEICDETGHTLGQFIPLENRDLYRDGEVPVSEDELQAAESELGGRTLAEIIADLEKQP